MAVFKHIIIFATSFIWLTFTTQIVRAEKAYFQCRLEGGGYYAEISPEDGVARLVDPEKQQQMRLAIRSSSSVEHYSDGLWHLSQQGKNKPWELSMGDAFWSCGRALPDKIPEILNALSTLQRVAGENSPRVRLVCNGIEAIVYPEERYVEVFDRVWPPTKLVPHRKPDFYWNDTKEISIGHELGSDWILWIDEASFACAADGGTPQNTVHEGDGDNAWPTVDVSGKSLGGNLRVGPGIQFAKVSSLAEGTWITIVRNTGVEFDGYYWFEVMLESGKKAYQWGGILCANDGKLAGVLTACDAIPNLVSRLPLNGEWILSIIYDDGNRLTVPATFAEDYPVTIQPDGSLDSYFGCNTLLGGHLDVAYDGTILSAGFGRTEMFCPDELEDMTPSLGMTVEDGLASALGNAKRVELTETSLSLIGADGSELAQLLRR